MPPTASRQSAKPPARRRCIGLGLRRIAADGHHLRDFAAVEFAGHRMMGHEKVLCSVSKRLAHSPDAAAIGRDESITGGDVGGNGQARDSGCSGQTAGDEFAAGDRVAHKASFREAAGRPVIMAQHAGLEPAQDHHGDMNQKKENEKICQEEVHGARASRSRQKR